MKKSGISVLYFLIGLIQIILQNNTAPAAGLIAKALIIPALIILLLYNITLKQNNLNRYMLLALVFSWTGDIVLDLPVPGHSMFVPGLIAFLLAHIMYLTVFLKTPGTNYIKASRAWVLLPVLIYGVVLIALFYNGLKEMKLPVMLYTAIILVMLSGAINRKEKVSRKSYHLVLAGAILFVISDSSIAVNSFISHFAYSGVVIMSTYITAQFLIVTGYIHQVKPTDAKQEQPI